MFRKLPSATFNGNSFSGSSGVTWGRTDGHDEPSRRIFASFRYELAGNGTQAEQNEITSHSTLVNSRNCQLRTLRNWMENYPATLGGNSELKCSQNPTNNNCQSTRLLGDLTQQFSYVTLTGRLHISRRPSHYHGVTSRDRSSLDVAPLSPRIAVSLPKQKGNIIAQAQRGLPMCIEEWRKWWCFLDVLKSENLQKGEVWVIRTPRAACKHNVVPGRRNATAEGASTKKRLAKNNVE
jgi:hypothetical protein